MTNALVLPPNAVAFVDNRGQLTIPARSALEKTLNDLQTQINILGGVTDGSVAVGNSALLNGQSSGFYLDRTNHVGAQAISTVTGLQADLDSRAGPFTDPNADRIAFWDDSAGAWAFLSVGANLTITGTTLDATGGCGGRPSRLTTIGDVRVTASGDIRTAN